MKIVYENFYVCVSMWTFRVVEKRFYNRKTITALNYVILQMSVIPPFLLYETKIIDFFLNWRFLANHDELEGLLANAEILICKGDCFSIVKSLLM